MEDTNSNSSRVRFVCLHGNTFGKGLNPSSNLIYELTNRTRIWSAHCILMPNSLEKMRVFWGNTMVMYREWIFLFEWLGKRCIGNTLHYVDYVNIFQTSKILKISKCLSLKWNDAWLTLTNDMYSTQKQNRIRKELSPKDFWNVLDSIHISKSGQMTKHLFCSGISTRNFTTYFYIFPDNQMIDSNTYCSQLYGTINEG